MKQVRLKQITKLCYPNFFWGGGDPPLFEENSSGKFSAHQRIKVGRPALFNEKRRTFRKLFRKFCVTFVTTVWRCKALCFRFYLANQISVYVFSASEKQGQNQSCHFVRCVALLKIVYAVSTKINLYILKFCYPRW